MKPLSLLTFYTKVESDSAQQGYQLGGGIYKFMGLLKN